MPDLGKGKDYRFVKDVETATGELQSYETHPTFTIDTQIVDKKYVDDTAVPGGSTTQVQFNNAGIFGGSADFVWTGNQIGIGTGGAAQGAYGGLDSRKSGSVGTSAYGNFGDVGPVILNASPPEIGFNIYRASGVYKFGNQSSAGDEGAVIQNDIYGSGNLIFKLHANLPAEGLQDTNATMSNIMQLAQNGQISAMTANYDTLVTSDQVLTNRKFVINQQGRERRDIINFGLSPYSVTTTNQILLVDTSGGNVVLNLPTALEGTDVAGLRFRVIKTTTDANTVTITPNGGDTINFQSNYILRRRSDSVSFVTDRTSNWNIIADARGIGFQRTRVDTDNSLGTVPILQIATAGNKDIPFHVPDDFLSLISLNLILAPSAGAAGSGKNIDLNSNYGALTELYNVHSESDTTTLYDFTGLTNTWTTMDISGVFSSLSPNDYCGLNVNHSAIGGAINYFAVEMIYYKRG